jgi:hypothetical protein
MIAGHIRRLVTRRVFTSPSMFAVPANACALVVATMKRPASRVNGSMAVGAAKTAKMILRLLCNRSTS